MIEFNGTHIFISGGRGGGASAYCVSKAGQIIFARCMAHELGADGIRVIFTPAQASRFRRRNEGRQTRHRFSMLAEYDFLALDRRIDQAREMSLGLLHIDYLRERQSGLVWLELRGDFRFSVSRGW